MESDCIMSQIMVQYQKKFTIITELHRLTEEMVQLLSHDDRVSTQLILKMRQEEMQNADRCSAAIALLEDSMNSGERQHLRSILNDSCPAKTFEEKKIREIYQSIRTTLDKTITVDKRVNMKIAGKDSYYQSK